MLKNILNITGAQKLEKEEQSFIKGGIQIDCDHRSDCPFGWECSGNGNCFRPECTSNSDCGPGDICVNYNCQTC